MATSDQTEPPHMEEDPPEQEKNHQDGFISSGDELEHEPADDNEERVELVIVDPSARVCIRDCFSYM